MFLWVFIACSVGLFALPFYAGSVTIITERAIDVNGHRGTGCIWGHGGAGVERMIGSATISSLTGRSRRSLIELAIVSVVS